MAFNFNWSPLAADASFYARATEMLTTALNKSPKPPIIVDDIIVTELNLGSVPPDLEILEIGDLAEDRFRGIFKMCYTGDARITLRTRVQANPLNTYLSAKPSFTSPQPLAAADGLTIPLSITLSEIKLSAFIILVFSKQKGLTIVFRNDPLESLKVSSTFDSIQFVRDYLQKTIETQLRNLMMDELPAIIHRLSLQLWCPDQMARTEDQSLKERSEENAEVDALAKLPQTPVNSTGQVLDANQIASLASDGGSELHSLFEQRNLLRLAALGDSHRTLSLFTPGIRNTMFRAWVGAAERQSTGTSTPLATPSLVRMQSLHGSSTTYTFTDTSSVGDGQLPSRPSLVSMHSATAGLSLAGARHSRTRKKKTRVVNLRKTPASETSSEVSDTATSSDSTSFAGPSSEPIMQASIPEEDEELILTQSQAQQMGRNKVHFQQERDVPRRPPLNMDIYQDPAASSTTSAQAASEAVMARQAKAWEAAANARLASERHRPAGSESSVILEQAWIMKMAGEIARRVYDEKQRHGGDPWADREDAPPPAYEATH
ncbi:mitochondrial distribution and morphology protein 34 [Microdochium nivale]|nr:mitochondrial distribution and morphology protein 34 [Microdochium nivale]